MAEGIRDGLPNTLAKAVPVIILVDQAVKQALGNSLKEGLEKILALKERLPNVKVGGTRLFNPGWHTAQDIRYLIQISEIILRTALERKERRGDQWRLDFDGPDEELGIERREIPPMAEHLAELFDGKVADMAGGEKRGPESQF